MVKYNITNLHLYSVEQTKHPTKLQSVKINGKYHTKIKGVKKEEACQKHDAIWDVSNDQP